MTIERKRVVVNGTVQGVFFRASTAETARSLGVNGWVRNLFDGRVEAVFEGEPEQVARAVEWTHRGPDRAYVTSVEEYDEEPEGLDSFAVH